MEQYISKEVKSQIDLLCNLLCYMDELSNGDSEGIYPLPEKVIEDLQRFAKYFFELGLKTKTDKELVEEIHFHLDSIKDTADRMTSGNFMHHRAAIKFSANTIAKVLELIGLKTHKGE